MIHQDFDNRNSVTSEYSALAQRVLGFSLDQAGSELPFSRSIARENGWSTDYTQRVIEEYKRFAFLATLAGHPVLHTTSSIGWSEADTHFPLLIPES